jgi:transcriptional regulator of acetoin/glycerol metabolism
MIHRLTESKSELQIGALENRPTEIWKMRSSFERANQLCGWESKVDLEEGLRRTKWNKSKLAKELGISRAGLIMKVEKYGLDKRNGMRKDGEEAA